MIIHGDSLIEVKKFVDESIDCVITSPPYFGLRDYNVDGQIGLEETPEQYIHNLVSLFKEVKRVLRNDGVVWLNLGDTYSADRWTSSAGSGINSNGKNKEWSQLAHKKNSGLPAKNLIGIPWRVALALQADGWYLRQDIIWHKPNPMPESVKDRCTKAHEYIFLLTKSEKYYFDNEAIKEPVKKDWGTRNRTNGKYHNAGTGLHPHSGLEKSYKTRNKRSVWTVATKPFKDAHFAVFPENLIIPMVKATRKDAVILDPFLGAGTTAVVAQKYGRKWLGIELNKEYIKIAEKRLKQQVINLV